MALDEPDSAQTHAEAQLQHALGTREDDEAEAANDQKLQVKLLVANGVSGNAATEGNRAQRRSKELRQDPIARSRGSAPPSQRNGNIVNGTHTVFHLKGALGDSPHAHGSSARDGNSVVG